jgi:hypothetical protein
MTDRKDPPEAPETLQAPDGEPALEKPDFASPALWLFLILIPLILSAYYAFAPAEKPAETQLATAAVGQPAPRSRVLGLSVTGTKPAEGAPEEVARCGFEELLGLPPGKAILERIKTEGMIYRILKPGSPMTMDYNPNRVNLELDGYGAIQRVWCG